MNFVEEDTFSVKEHWKCYSFIDTREVTTRSLVESVTVTECSTCLISP